MVGLIPLFAVETLEPELLDASRHSRSGSNGSSCIARPDRQRRLHADHGQWERRLLSIVDREQLRRVLKIMLDENEFLSPYGIRALSRFHHEHPYVLRSTAPTTGSTTSRRNRHRPVRRQLQLAGPGLVPGQLLLVEACRSSTTTSATSSRWSARPVPGTLMTLQEVAHELPRRLTRFSWGRGRTRPVAGAHRALQSDPHWRDYVLFHEYFHGDNGAGLGASHQTGWTGLVAKMLQQSGLSRHAAAKAPALPSERAPRRVAGPPLQCPDSSS